MRPSRLIDSAGRTRIEAAVREAEAGTSGEILVAVERRAARHAAAAWRFAAFAAATTLLATAWFLPAATGLELFAVQVGAVILAHAACLLDGVRRLFTRDDELERAARRAALQAFMEHGVRRTRERTGILIYVALLEHRVVVLGDEAVDRALGPDESWDEVVALVLRGIRSGRAVDGLIDAVRACGEILSHPLPPRDDDRDEIAQALILSE